MPGSPGVRVSKKRVNARHVQVTTDVRRGDPATAEIADQSERDSTRARFSIQLQAYRMGLFKRFGAAAGPVLLGRNHGTGRISMRQMPTRVAMEYAAAGAAAGAPIMKEFDVKVRSRKRA